MNHELKTGRGWQMKYTDPNWWFVQYFGYVYPAAWRIGRHRAEY